MNKWFRPTLISSALLLTSAVSFAGGPDTYSQGLRSHWSLSILGGAGISISNLEASYTNSTLGTIEDFDTTGYNTAGILGGELGYSFAISHSNFLGLSFNANYFFNGKVKETWFLGSTIASSDPMNLENTIKPKWQYNFAVSLMHDLGNSLSIGVDGGFSILQERSTLSVRDIGAATAGSQAATGNNAKTSYLPGGMLGLKASLLTTKCSSLDFALDYYIYSSKKLSEIGSIDTGANDKLDQRKLFISMPAFLLKYTYHF